MTTGNLYDICDCQFVLNDNFNINIIGKTLSTGRNKLFDVRKCNSFEKTKQCLIYDVVDQECMPIWV